jgi:carboxymethylenebutenolidase
MRKLFVLVCVLTAGCSAKKQNDPSASSEVVSYRSDADTVRGVLYRPAGKGPFPAVIVIHGDMGLNDTIKERAKALADSGFVALCVDLYRGEKVDNMDDAHIMDRGVPEERVKTDLKAAVDFLAGRDDVKADRLGVVGFDMGGGYALDAAIADSRLKAVVSCDGRVPASAARLAPLKASVLWLVAGKSLGLTPDVRQGFEKAMKKADKKLTIQVFDSAEDGFVAPAKKPTTQDKNATEAWEKAETFLKDELAR